MIKTNVPAHEAKLSKFFLLYSMAIERGQLQLPPSTRNQAVSVRSQLNRFRKDHRGEIGTENWDLVSNKLVQLTDNTWTIRMVYEKAFWGAIDEVLGIKDMFATQKEDVIVSPEAVPNITDLLSDTFGVQ